MHDPQPEVLARHILFLKILNDTTLAIRERAELFLSIYGNTTIRQKDDKYIQDSLKMLEKIVIDESDHALSQLVDTSTLKYKDADAVQDAVHSWSKSRKIVFCFENFFKF